MRKELGDWIEAGVVDLLMERVNLRTWEAQAIGKITIAAIEMHLLHDNVEAFVERERRMWRQYEKITGMERPADAPQQEAKDAK